MKKERLSLIPMEEKFMTNKKMNDLLYGYLQSISYITKEKKRFVYKKDFNQSTIAAMLQVSLSTVKRYFKNLKDFGFIIDGSTEDLKGGTVPVLFFAENFKLYQLVPNSTIEFLLHTAKGDVIKVYSYLLNKYQWKVESNDLYVFNKKELLSAIGINVSNNKEQYDKINDILLCLFNNGLIDYVEFYEQNKQCKPTPKLRLTKVNTIVKGLEKKTEKEIKKEQSIIEKYSLTDADGKFNF